MNKILLSLAALTLGMSLVACSTNTREQNTVLGGATGAVVGGVGAGLLGGNAGAIAISAVAGAIIGGLIGHSMDSSDTNEMNHIMNNTPAHTTEHWVNNKTGASFTITPTSENMTIRGKSPCRKYRATTVTGDKHETTTGILCRQTDGNWASI